MRITGNAVLNAPAAQVWAALNDPGVLSRTIPGCERLEAAGPDRYAMTITAGVASIKGTYQGDVALADPLPPDSFTLRASGAGTPGSVQADVRITLACSDGVTTTVSYDADAVVGGPVGGVGQRVISAVAKRTAAQFFSAVDQEISGSAPGATVGNSGVAVEKVRSAVQRELPAVREVPSRADLPSVLLGASVALAGVLVGWAIGRSVNRG